MLYIDKNLEVRGIVYAYDYFNTKIFSYGKRDKTLPWTLPAIVAKTPCTFAIVVTWYFSLIPLDYGYSTVKLKAFSIRLNMTYTMLGLSQLPSQIKTRKRLLLSSDTNYQKIEHHHQWQKSRNQCIFTWQ